MSGLGGLNKSEGMICSFDGTPMVEGGEHPVEVVTGEVVPRLADEARESLGVENNVYQLGHRGYIAREGGATDCPYTYMKDLVKRNYRLRWEEKVKVRDGTSEGFPSPRSGERVSVLGGS